MNRIEELKDKLSSDDYESFKESMDHVYEYYKKDELNLFCVTPEDSMKGHWVKVMGSIFQLNRKKDFLIITSVLK